MECLKCGYVRGANDSHVHEGLCPQCGIAYSKWEARLAPKAPQKEDAPVYTFEPKGSWLNRLWGALIAVPERVDALGLLGRFVLYVLFFFWGWSFILGGVDWVSIGGSFLHNANLPFHEFGHVLFQPFGRFMMILGGSLFQVLMPLGLMLAFILQRRDNFAASIMLWWSGQNFIDVSPYIADAKYRSIPLIRGLGEQYHDWGNLLSMTGTLGKVDSYANLSFGIGVSLMLVSFSWGGYLLERQRRRLNHT